MITTLCFVAGAVSLAQVEVAGQHLQVTLDPARHYAQVTSYLAVGGSGPLTLRLTTAAEDLTIDSGDVPIELTREAGAGVDTLRLTVPPATEVIRLAYHATFEDDVAAGEIAGQVHNFSVDAHLGEEGIFLSDGSAWHPRPVDARGVPILHLLRAYVEPIDGWAIVASGDPMGEADLDQPCWQWSTPRPADGMAIAGNQHVVTGVLHETVHGPVEITMHLPVERADLAPMFIDAARSYLDLYVPALGAYPYRRFSIVENFFSSGFAYPGFTVLGPRVVAMAPRSLMPGFLDHELLHNWWGNGVYVSPEDGNWCEGLTSYCTNYFRRSVEGGEEALLDYRRTTLMKLSADVAGLDDAPLGVFGSADPTYGGSSRFVGYDTGAFLFMMLESDPRITGDVGRENDRLWNGLRLFAAEYMGRRATWDDLRASLEETYGVDLAPFWDRWVREHTVPRTPTSSSELEAFLAHAAPEQDISVVETEVDGRTMIEIDPEFRFYRALAPSQIVPLMGGTTGPGGLRLEAPDRPELASLRPQFDLADDGENLMLVGREAVARHAALIARSGDPITAEAGAFTVGGTRWDGAKQAVLHTMVHPDRPGRFITVFLANGEPGWARLRLIPHYRRDTTVVWDDGQVVERRVFEPDRRFAAN